MTRREIEAEAALIRSNPIERHDIAAPPVVYGPLGFERHELIAMALCIAIGGLFAVGVYFLPVVARWIVG